MDQSLQYFFLKFNFVCYQKCQEYFPAEAVYHFYDDVYQVARKTVELFFA
jgi:hypothetical protein